MADFPLTVLTAATLLAACPVASRAQQRGPGRVEQAHPAPRFDPAARCPGLRVAIVEDQPAAAVRFRVGVTGVPSQAAIRSSSRSEDLDAAAVSCVLKLRFLPATRLGEGTAIESWQELALQWARPAEHGTSSHPPVAPAAVSPPAPASTAAGSRTDPPPRPAATGGAVVRACVDARGALAGDPLLVRSSGDPVFDQAALRVASAGSRAYRPVAGGAPLADCLRLTISTDTR